MLLPIYLAIQLPVYLPNWLPTLSRLSFWRQTGDKPIFEALPLAKLKKLSTPFVSLLHACDRAENLCFPSLLLPLHTRRHRMLSWIARPFFNRPPVKGFFLVLACDLSLCVLCSPRFSIRIFLAYPSFSLVYPFLLYFFTPLPVCYTSFFFHFKFFLHLQNLHVHPSLCSFPVFSLITHVFVVIYSSFCFARLLGCICIFFVFLVTLSFPSSHHLPSNSFPRFDVSTKSRKQT